jgi:tRNA pseudouridine55 synthase
VHGWLVLDKPLGLGSTDAVTAVKRALRAGGYPKVKVGHGGTLDPLATGVLPIALGEATKLAGRLLDSDKAYEFTVRFGEETDTLDAEGRVVATNDVRPTFNGVEDVLGDFLGSIEQVPPAYSALKIGGKRAYDLARSGQEVGLASRSVVVRALDVVSGPGYDPIDEATLCTHVSKGTYIRSLARDIARALGTIGHVTHLRRTKAGPFDLAHAITLDKLAEFGHARRLEHLLLPLRTGLDDIPALALTPDQAGALRQGRVLAGIAADEGQHLALLDEVPVALVEVRDRTVRVVRGFNLCS